MYRNFGKYVQIDSALYYRITLVDATCRICSQSCEAVKRQPLLDSHVINHCLTDESCHKRTWSYCTS